MKTLPYNEVIENILNILEKVQKGEEIIIKSATTRENIAIIIPYNKYQQQYKSKIEHKRPLGILKGKASYKIKEDFKISDEEMKVLW